jgi:hypothetical protein
MPRYSVCSLLMLVAVLVYLPMIKRVLNVLRFVEIQLTRKFCFQIRIPPLPPYNQPTNQPTPENRSLHQKSADALLAQKSPSVWIPEIYYRFQA